MYIRYSMPENTWTERNSIDVRLDRSITLKYHWLGHVTWSSPGAASVFQAFSAGGLKYLSGF